MKTDSGKVAELLDNFAKEVKSINSWNRYDKKVKMSTFDMEQLMLGLDSVDITWKGSSLAIVQPKGYHYVVEFTDTVGDNDFKAFLT
jgi:hypothetical protein